MASTHKPIVAAFVSACVSAFLILQPATSSAVTTTGYEAFGDTAGVVLWRADASRDTLFHTSTVADVAADGTIGTAYAMTADSSAKSWKRFASNQTNYSAPGMLLVFDAADDGNGNNYTASTDAQFAPLSFGGLWVKSLASDGTPFTITDNKTDWSDRKVELGASGYSTLFKFDESFTFSRNSAVEVKGTGTVEIASLATFTINARENKGAKVDSGNTLVLTGAGALAVTGGLAVGGTLDISAAPVPTIIGDVTLAADSTIVLPAGTAVGSDVNILVCNGTLAVGGPVYVKIGSADPVSATLTVSNGMITLIETTSTYTATISGDTAFSAIQWQKNGASATISSMETAILEISGSGTVTGLAETPTGITLVDSSVVLDATSVPSLDSVAKNGNGTFLFTANYPQTVPAGLTYEYHGGATESAVVTISGAFDNYGCLKTSGYLVLSDFAMPSTATLDVLSGQLAVNCSQEQLLRGDIYIRENAVFVNQRTSDALNYGQNANIHVYGTLDMGATRWSLGSNNKIYIYENGSVTGTGQSSGTGALDCIDDATVIFYVNGTATISAPVKIRASATARFDVANGKTLTLSGSTIGAGKVDKRVGGVLKFTGDPTYSEISVGNGTLQFDTENDVDPVVVYAVSTLKDKNMDYVSQSNWKGRVVVSAIDAGTNSTQVALNKAGNANSYLTLNGISGNAWCAGSDYTVLPEVTLAGNVNFQNGSSGKTVVFRKIAAGTGNLSLKTWQNCTGITYGFTTLDANNYTGTIQLDGSVMTFNVGDILKNNASLGNALIPLDIANDANLNFANAALNGTSTNLCYATVNNVSGIYIAAAKIGSTYYPTLTDAINARRSGVRGTIEVLDGTAAVPEGYIVDGGKLVRRAFLINIK